MNTPIITPKLRSTCKDCKFYDPAPEAPGLGMCHRHPPTLYGGVMHRKVAGGNIEEYLNNSTAWPIVGQDQWCGEWVLNLLKAEVN